MTFLLKWGDVDPKAPCMKYFATFYDEFPHPNVWCSYVSPMEHMGIPNRRAQFSGEFPGNRKKQQKLRSPGVPLTWVAVCHRW